MSRSLALAAVLLLALPSVLLAQGAARPTPPAFHVGSFNSRLAARLDTDGRFDSGAGVLQLVHGTTGQPLALSDMRHPKGPSLLVTFTSELGGARVEGVCLATPESTQGDTRLVAAMQVKLTNPTEEPLSVALGAHVMPGGGDPERRPYPSKPFEAMTAFALEDGLLTRDGHALLLTRGPDPRIEVSPAVDGPDAVAARLGWELEIAPGRSQIVEVKLAGVPVGGSLPGLGGRLAKKGIGLMPEREILQPEPTVAEDAWRARFPRNTFARKEEKLRWQHQFRGAIAAFRSAHKGFLQGLVGGIYSLRSLGAAPTDVNFLTDRPYGHPPVDEASEAEILACMVEWGLSDIALSYLDTLIEELPERTRNLSPERRLAYVHSLARCVRLAPPSERDIVLANAILAYASQPVPVPPWHDPAVVRLDLGAILETGGLGDASMLPEFQWAEVEPGSVEGRMQDMRRAISAGDGDAAWALCEGLLDEMTVAGMGSMTPGGELDGRFATGMLTLQRALLIDDHGMDFVVFPAVSQGLMRQHKDIDTTSLPTRFGVLRARLYHSSAKIICSWMNFRPTNPYGSMYVRLPDGWTGMRLHGEPSNGTAELAGDGDRVLVEPALRQARGFQFMVRVRKDA